jgi:hypothetical protein
MDNHSLLLRFLAPTGLRSSPGGCLALRLAEPSVERRRAFQPTTSAHLAHDLRGRRRVVKIDGEAGPGALGHDGRGELIDVLGVCTRALGHVPSIALRLPSSSLRKFKVTHYPTFDRSSGSLASGEHQERQTHSFLVLHWKVEKCVPSEHVLRDLGSEYTARPLWSAVCASCAPPASPTGVTVPADTAGGVRHASACRWRYGHRSCAPACRQFPDAPGSSPEQ